jgi:hypothetical protein
MAEAIMRKDAAIGLSYSRELQAAMEERLGFRDLGFWSEAEASRGREGWRRKERGKHSFSNRTGFRTCEAVGLMVQWSNRVGSMV